jgi:transposase
MTQGRARSHGADLALDTLVKITALGQRVLNREMSERLAVLRIAASPMSIAEVSARIGVHLGIARVIVSDLAADGLLAVSEPLTGDARPDLPTLERLLNDLQAY